MRLRYQRNRLNRRRSLPGILLFLWILYHHELLLYHHELLLSTRQKLRFCQFALEGPLSRTDGGGSSSSGESSPAEPTQEARPKPAAAAVAAAPLLRRCCGSENLEPAPSGGDAVEVMAFPPVDEANNGGIIMIMALPAPSASESTAAQLLLHLH